MWRLGVGRLDAFEFDALDAVGDARLLFLQARDFAALVGNDGIELFAQSFQVGDVRFEAREAFGGVLGHAVKLRADTGAPTKFCLHPPAPPRILNPCAGAPPLSSRSP